MEENIILGIDPGTNIMGYALLKSAGNRSEVLKMGVIKMTRLKDQSEKLTAIFNAVNQLITEYKPTVLAIEAPFLGKNPQSMLKLGRAQVWPSGHVCTTTCRFLSIRHERSSRPSQATATPRKSKWPPC